MKILISIGHYYNKVAILDNRELIDFFVEEKERHSTVGNIYMAKISNVLPGMQSLFVDAGLYRDVFVYVGDIQKTGSDTSKKETFLDINKLFRVGDFIVVQIIKDPIGSKGARGTTKITIPGHFIVLTLNDSHIGVSKKIEDEEERKRLKDLFESVVKRQFGDDTRCGVIVRTAACYREEDDLLREFDYLVKEWERVANIISNSKKKGLIYEEPDLLLRIIRDYYTKDFDEIIIDDRRIYKKIKDFILFMEPDREHNISFYNESLHQSILFDKFGVTELLNKAINRKVELKGGSYLVIDHTEALTAIDVNTGGYVGKENLENTVFEVNKLAAMEIARQLRIRDIGGIIIIDFIDMKDKEHQETILNILKDGFKHDKTKVSIKSITDFGLVEMTRKRIKNPIKNTLMEVCKHCNGTGYIISKKEVIDRIFHAIKANRFKIDRCELVVSSELFDYINENKLKKIFDKLLGKRIKILRDENLKLEEFIIE